MRILKIAVHVVLISIAFLLVSVVTLWTAGAVYYDVGRGRWFAWPLMLLWFVGVVVSFVYWKPMWQPLVAFYVVFALFLAWWFSQQPSSSRNWNPNFAVLPSFEIDGDVVTAYNVRNTDYRTVDDFTPHYETRTLHLANLQNVDAVITFWGSAWMCHPMLIFDFGADGRLCMSIEVRYRQGQKYGFLRSLYRQQEIMYVVTDERDSLLKRTKYSSDEEVYLYRLNAERDEMLRCFLDYVVSTNGLTVKPRWYHGLTANCTTSIYRQRSRHSPWDWRWLFNGSLDEMMYDHGRLDRRLPFATEQNQRDC